MKRYRSEHSDRWTGFEHRPGDIVVSTRSKCGTTWIQMICLSLIHGTPLPAPLAQLSPWIDWDAEPRPTALQERLAEQPHRRVIKTHTPLDGIPLRSDVRYLVVGRHPLDVAVSLYHHLANIDQARSAELRGHKTTAPELGTITEWMEAWIHDPRPPEEALDTLAGNVHHVSDAWERQANGNVMLVHFTELAHHREATIRRLATWLEVDIPDNRWLDLIDATSFDSMRAEPEKHTPDGLGVLRSAGAFFRSGGVGEGARLCSDDALRRYHERMATLASPAVSAWLDQT